MSNVVWDFSGRVVAVTGSASGMGATAVQAFASAGAEVYGLDVDEVNGEEVAAAAGACFLRCDVTDAGAVETAFDRVERVSTRLDVLINNAGGFWHQHTTESLPVSEWDAVVDLNLKGVFLCTRRALPLLRRSRAGRIITLSSLAGQTAIYQSSPAYAAAKAGVLALSRVFAYETAADGITSNAIAPSAVMTDRIREVRSPEERARTEARVPLGRYGTTDEIVNWMMFLASDEAAYMTGQTVAVNGGRLMA